MRDSIRKLNINNYDYDLPAERIAQYPARERDRSKLLIYRTGNIKTDIFRNISEYLPPDSLLVFNNTRVIRARLLFTKPTGSIIEILLLEPLSPSDYTHTFASVNPVEWKCMIGNLKKWKKGTITLLFKINEREYELLAEKAGPADEGLRVRFSWDPEDISFAEVLGSAGHIPLPPYVNREDEEIDNIRYQTVYGRIRGSVAAPTAGLHFTDHIINDILNKGIKRTEITLHVGAGTFQPVRTNDITDHVMHCEHFSVSYQTIETLLSYHNRIIAVGTTSVRTLESIYWLGRKVMKQRDYDDVFFTEQWEPYHYCGREISVKESLEALLKIIENKGTGYLTGSTGIIIIPGYKFRMINGMITNFHQPRSTLLLLVSAWVGDDWRKLYYFAINRGFRFLSYGDSSLLIK
ncbi:MAG TPA: S-adenosylmethionine tRNA ribosyltransferase [Bacteroidales bacterium]|nr:S-adenosylmethionine tRNA ribosyltransferase [Bacteroidales bacterium]